MAHYTTQDEPTIPVTLTTGDLEIGAVEIKNATDDTRAVVGAASGAASATVSLAVADGNLHDSLGAVGAAADPDGVLHGQLRSIAENTDALPTALGAAAAAACLPVALSTEDAAKVPALGAAAAAASVPVALSTEDAAKVPSLGGAAAAASVPVTLATEDAAKVPALGVAASAASSPVVLASDDAHLGAVGATADPDGVIHGQLRSIAENTDALPAALGSAADAASLPVTQSTEDKAVLSGMSAKLPASLGVKAAAASLSVAQATEDAARFPASLGSKADSAAFPVTMSTEDKAKVPALGTAAMAASRPVTLATDDTQSGAVGAAADADGNFHGQLRYGNEALGRTLNLAVAPVSIAIGTSTARQAGGGLTVGTTYAVYVSAPCYVKRGNDAVEATTSDPYMEPGMVAYMTPTADNSDDNVACIGAVAGGKVFCQPCTAAV